MIFFVFLKRLILITISVVQCAIINAGPDMSREQVTYEIETKLIRPLLKPSAQVARSSCRQDISCFCHFSARFALNLSLPVFMK
jgi:hypothetical protein